MKKFYYKFTFLAVILLVTLLSSGCSKNSAGETGPAGPTGPTGGYVMQFQNGAYPATAYTGVEATTLDSLSSTVNFSTLNPSAVGYADTGSEKVRYTINYNLTTMIPNNVIVTAAYLSISVTTIYGSPSITVYPLTTAFTTSTATWINSATATPWTIPGGDFSLTPKSNTVAISAPGTYTFTLDKAIVQGWISSPSSNYGIILVASNETSGDNVAYFNSNASTTATSRPILTIYYKLP